MKRMLQQVLLMVCAMTHKGAYIIYQWADGFHHSIPIAGKGLESTKQDQSTLEPYINVGPSNSFKLGNADYK